MNIKTWQERTAACEAPRHHDFYTCMMQAEIDELRAALQECDAELELIRVERNSLRVDIEFSRGTAEYWKAEHLAGNAVIAAQRKVLERSLEALQMAHRVLDKSLRIEDAITAIQEVLK